MIEIEVMVGIIRDARGRVLVNQRLPGTHMAGFWEFPGGKRRDNESREAALARELQEELGIQVLRAEPLLELAHEYPERIVHLDVWTILDFEGEPESREGQAIDWVVPDSLRDAGLLPADLPIVVELLKARVRNSVEGGGLR